MLFRWSQLILAVVSLAPCYADGLQADTAQLAGHLKLLRAHRIVQMPAGEFDSTQRRFLTWIESRIGKGFTVQQMNAELASAQLLSDGPHTVDDMFDKDYVGFVGEVEDVDLHLERGLFAIKFGIHTGSYCNFDETLVLYARDPMRRLAKINAAQPHRHGHHLREAAVGKDVPNRGRLIASAWVASNCTSNWNGNIFRIDRQRGQILESVFHKGVDSYLDDRLRISTEGDTVTFHYTSSDGDASVLIREAIARYRIRHGRAVRQAPLAPSFGGFIDEWLVLGENDVPRWSARAAIAQHRALVARLKKGSFSWKYAADCAGAVLAREIGIRWDDSGRITVFRISGSSAAELRMLSVSDSFTPGCREIDLSSGLDSILAEPAR
ncbi:hypothetical protein [uncultured Paludibaculum sp.]|uniref:hypothetical protein n=1 Tax=uncultured Paludibaculum sp. TaxID=1765020 RepID=UPI002AAB6874|nr:hypothetical protein [uncultured Paludibaculum sp.]